ncbi:MAG: hypothetical protein M3O70_05490 [Actinomycetota bacterium]|nr:hypothetical protein [Actinomycetota bacterium]
MAALKLPRPITEDVVSTIRRCGDGRRECIAYVVASISSRQRASGVLHPEHTATAVSTEVGPGELERVWEKLASAQQTIVLQVHSHPGAAHHSGIDDRWPVVHRVGFPSLVLADFGAAGLTGSHLAIYLGNGKWESPPPDRWSDYLVCSNMEDDR